MKKVVALINQNHDLKSICDRLLQRGKFYTKKVSELEDQIKNVRTAQYEENKVDFESMENLLYAELKAVDYDIKKHILVSNEHLGVVLIEDRESHMDPLKQLFEKLGLIKD